jgi:hypothetical protein
MSVAISQGLMAMAERFDDRLREANHRLMDIEHLLDMRIPKREFE